MGQDNKSKEAEVRAEINGAVGTLILHNPVKHNALPQRCWEAIPDQINILLDAGSRVIVVTGAGKSFCAGADISEFASVRKNAETARVYEASNSAAFAAIRCTPVPTIARIRGYCLGGGFGLAAACDLRFAETGAEFAVPAAKLGLAYPVDAMADIVNAVGEQNARFILFTARRFSAQTARDFGFVSSISSAGDLDELVNDVAEEISSLAPLTHQATKAAIAAAQGGDPKTAEQLGSRTFTSKDYAEGLAGFREKRTPKFNGN